ncbi:hypothetical protein [Amycolatopsis taiwanensis]|uniref:Uncharacterized protein n=1 Tax=Amycolatopsis taiwanensis TaxID=342230 RepID=A0A9W6QV02_9PSEU|nr:hypothetical protein [Amycolatopsis taiwanensis]GLY64654.1 hypothetical protein Atai01_12730 [Amycolatopsis taiwanensis]
MADDNTGGSPGSIATGISGGDQQVKAIADAAQHYLDMAKAGDWAIDEETGTHLRSAFAHAMERLAQIGNKTYLLEQPPKVGKDNYARQVSKHMLASVNSDRYSLLPTFNAIKDALTKWHAAIDEAIRHYNATDEAATKHFGPVKD